MFDASRRSPGACDALAAAWQLARCGDPDAAAEAARPVRHAAEAAGDAAGLAAAELLTAWLCFQRAMIEDGIAAARAARALFDTLGDEGGRAAAGALKAWLLLEAGLTEEAGEEAVAALQRAEACGQPFALSLAANVVGVVLWYSKQPERALEHAERAVALARRGGDRVVLGWWLINLGGIHAEAAYLARRRGDEPACRAAMGNAIAINAESIAIAGAEGDVWGHRLALCNAAEYLAAIGRADEALAALAACETVAGAATRRSHGQFLYIKAQVLIGCGRLDEALPLCLEALALAQALGDADMTAHALRYLADIHEGLGDFGAALAAFRRYHDAQMLLSAEATQRRVRIAELRYETGKLRSLAAAADERAAALVRATMVDPLTGLWNRRALEETEAALRRSGRSYAMAMIDLDHFKSINDRFSHRVGDEVLRRVAVVLGEICRLDDLAVRMGGEEFALILDGVEAKGASRICLYLRRRIADIDWRDVEPGLRVTASFGFATSTEGADPAAVLQLADHRLYRAKADGRDRVVGTGEHDRSRRLAS